uniref:Cyclic nucleotide-binding domain-containing protein n=1 Tax=Palpitomonas bilix TaxID=652834 RepID=A0A7S3GJZ9_9EUKA|mmetsp:Transcript_6630/g.16565  ORF Transcript_6630/g.16565 Transcript_6630/m.16565 type:complete len:1474 (+) Transcript_6630:356-4777(+)
MAGSSEIDAGSDALSLSSSPSVEKPIRAESSALKVVQKSEFRTDNSLHDLLMAGESTLRRAKEDSADLLKETLSHVSHSSKTVEELEALAFGSFGRKGKVKSLKEMTNSVSEHTEQSLLQDTNAILDQLAEVDGKGALDANSAGARRPSYSRGGSKVALEKATTSAQQRDEKKVKKPRRSRRIAPEDDVMNSLSSPRGGSTDGEVVARSRSGSLVSNPFPEIPAGRGTNVSSLGGSSQGAKSGESGEGSGSGSDAEWSRGRKKKSGGSMKSKMHGSALFAVVKEEAAPSELEASPTFKPRISVEESGNQLSAAGGHRATPNMRRLSRSFSSTIAVAGADGHIRHLDATNAGASFRRTSGDDEGSGDEGSDEEDGESSANEKGEEGAIKEEGQRKSVLASARIKAKVLARLSRSLNAGADGEGGSGDDESHTEEMDTRSETIGKTRRRVKRRTMTSRGSGSRDSAGDGRKLSRQQSDYVSTKKSLAGPLNSLMGDRGGQGQAAQQKVGINQTNGGVMIPPAMQFVPVYDPRTGYYTLAAAPTSGPSVVIDHATGLTSTEVAGGLGGAGGPRLRSFGVGGLSVPAAPSTDSPVVAAGGFQPRFRDLKRPPSAAAALLREEREETGVQVRASRRDEAATGSHPLEANPTRTSEKVDYASGGGLHPGMRGDMAVAGIHQPGGTATSSSLFPPGRLSHGDGEEPTEARLNESDVEGAPVSPSKLTDAIGNLDLTAVQKGARKERRGSAMGSHVMASIFASKIKGRLRKRKQAKLEEKKTWKSKAGMVGKVIYALKNARLDLYEKKGPESTEEFFNRIQRLARMDQLYSRHKYIILPNSRFRRNWEFLIFFLVLYSSLVIPYRIGFAMADNLVMQVFEYSMSLFFIADIVINFRTAYMKKETLVTEPKLIARKYVMSPMFYTDLLASLPFDLLSLISSFSAGSETRILSIFRLPRILRLSKGFSSQNKDSVDKLFQRIPGYVKQTAKMLMYLLLITHWMACVGALVGLTFELPSDEETDSILLAVETSITPEGLLNQTLYFASRTLHITENLNYIGRDPSTPFYANLAVNDFEHMQSNTTMNVELETYLKSLLFAFASLSSIGAQLQPYNQMQMMVTFLIMIVSIFAYALVIGTFTSIMQNFGAAERRFQEHQSQVEEYLSFRDIPDPIKERTRHYLESLWIRQRGMDETGILNELTLSLRTDISSHLHRNILESIPLFKGCDNNFFSSLCVLLRPIIFLPSEYIVRAGEAGESMFILSKGSVAVLPMSEDKVFAILRKGSYFGEISLLFEEKRTASVRAIEHCDCAELTATDFHKVLRHWPEVAVLMEEVALSRLREKKKAMEEERKDQTSFMNRITASNLQNQRPALSYGELIQQRANASGEDLGYIDEEGEGEGKGRVVAVKGGPSVLLNGRGTNGTARQGVMSSSADSTDDKGNGGVGGSGGTRGVGELISSARGRPMTRTLTATASRSLLSVPK